MRILVIYVYAMLCTLKVISYFCNQFEIIYVYNLKKRKANICYIEYSCYV